MTAEKKAIGVYDLKVSVNGGEPVSVHPTRLVIRIREGIFNIGGYTSTNWGAGASIARQDLKPGTYPFTDDSIVSGFYNANDPNDNASWPSESEGGEITLEAVNTVELAAKGHFKFRGRSRHNPDNFADVTCVFNIRE